MLRQFELVEKVLAYNPDADEALLNKAYVYAMTKHGSQRRASGDPYISHPIEVAGILADMRLDEATIAVALLHDTIEDTDATREDIEKGFGEEISSLVEALTKLKKLDLVTKRAQQAENLRRFLLATAKDIRVLLVKLADRLHNMRTLDHVPPDKRKRISEETMELYAPLAGRMGMQDMREELEDLCFRHINPAAYATVSALQNCCLKTVFKRKLQAVKNGPGRCSAKWKPRAFRLTACRMFSGSGYWLIPCKIVTAPLASFTSNGILSPAASKTIFRRLSKTTISRCTPQCLARLYNALNCKSAPIKCITLLNSALLRTLYTKTNKAARRAVQLQGR
jgi:hypothetical protein